MRLKIEVGCGIRDTLKARCRIKIGRRDRDILQFEGGIGVGTGIGRAHKKYFFALETGLIYAPV